MLTPTKNTAEHYSASAMQGFKAVGEKNTTSYFTVERWRVQQYVFLFSKGLVALTLTLRLPPYDPTPLGLEEFRCVLSFDRSSNLS